MLACTYIESTDDYYKAIHASLFIKTKLILYLSYSQLKKFCNGGLKSKNCLLEYV